MNDDINLNLEEIVQKCFISGMEFGMRMMKETVSNDHTVTPEYAEKEMKKHIELLYFELIGATNGSQENKKDQKNS